MIYIVLVFRNVFMIIILVISVRIWFFLCIDVKEVKYLFLIYYMMVLYLYIFFWVLEVLVFGD